MGVTIHDNHAMEEWARRVVRETKHNVRTSAEAIDRLAKRRAPVLTGTLRRSIQHHVEGDGFSALIGISHGAATAYARIQDLGGQAGAGGSVTIKGNRYLSDAFKEELVRFNERQMHAMRR